MRLVDKWPGYDDWLTRDLPDDEDELDDQTNEAEEGNEGEHQSVRPRTEA